MVGNERVANTYNKCFMVSIKRCSTLPTMPGLWKISRDPPFVFLPVKNKMTWILLDFRNICKNIWPNWTLWQANDAPSLAELDLQSVFFVCRVSKTHYYNGVWCPVVPVGVARICYVCKLIVQLERRGGVPVRQGQLSHYTIEISTACTIFQFK